MSTQRSVICYDDHNNEIGRYPSIKEAQSIYHCTHISTVCRGRRMKDKGFYWKYEHPKAEDFLPPKPRKPRKQNEPPYYLKAKR